MDFRQIVRERAVALGLDPIIAEATMMQESGGRADALSPKGAFGPMQLMPATARELGVNIKDPLQNIDGGLRYLRQQLDKFGNYEGALAAYNGGPGRFERVGRNLAAMPEETRNYAASIMAKAAKSSGAQQTEPVGQQQPPQAAKPAPAPGFDVFTRGLAKAQEAGDTEAVQYFQGEVKPRLEKALLRARGSGDTEAAEYFRKQRKELGVAPSFSDLGAKIYQQVEGKPFKGSPQEAEEYAKSFEAWKNNLFSQGKKALAVGSWNNDAQVAYLDLEDKYQDEVGIIEGVARGALPVFADPTTWVGLGFGKLAVKTGQEATKAAVRKGLEKSLAKRIGQSTATKVAAEGAVYGAAQDVSGQAGRVAAGGQDEVNLGQTAAVAGAGAVLGAGAGKLIDKVSGTSAVEKFARRAGSEEGARIDAELVQEIAKTADNPNFRGQPFRTEQLNTLTTGYIKEAQDNIKNIGAKSISEMGEDAKVLRDALQKWKTSNPESLRGGEVGNAVADAITKAQRMRSLTAELEASGGLSKMARGALEVAPISNPVRLAGRAVLGGAKSRKQTTAELLSDFKTANRVNRDLGPSALGDSAPRLATLAADTIAARAAAAQQAQAAREAGRRTSTAGAPGPLPENAPISKTVDKNARDVEAEMMKARDFQQFGDTPSNVASGAVAPSRPVLDELPIMSTIRKATLDSDAAGVPDGKPYVANEIKNILSGGKANPAEKRAAVAAERKAQKETAKLAEETRKKQIIDDFVLGKIGEDMRTDTPSFNTLAAYVDTTPETIVSALQQYAKQNPKRANSVIDVFTPGKKVNRQQFYTIQTDLQNQFGKKAPPKDAEGALAGASRDLDAKGNEIRAKSAYEGAKANIQKGYDRAIEKIEKMEGLSEKSKEIVQDAIDELATSSPREADRVIPEVRAALAKLTEKDREKVEPTVDKLVKRFLKNKPE